MLDHYLQREIVYQLAHTTSLRFSELQPAGIENKLFSYHLKKVMAAGLVSKNVAGAYELTAEGKRIGKGSLGSPRRMINRAYSLLLIAIREPDTDKWLLYQRPHQPFIGKRGFVQAQPEAGRAASEVAREALLRETGLDLPLVIHAHGYMSLSTGEVLESFIHFTLLVGVTDHTTTLPTDSPYSWQTSPNFHAPDMLPTMPILAAQVQKPAGGYIDIILSTP